jgi:inner membrane protein
MALLTHPLLDAFTVYGTQLFWPLPARPVMWASLFIIDPIYTLPLLMACAAAWWLRELPIATWCLIAGLSLSLAYLGWSLAAKAIVARAVQVTLAAEGMPGAASFSVPMPFNTLLWRVVVLTPDGFLEGERSVAVDRGPMAFRKYASDRAALNAVSGFPSVERLNWFTRGFLKAQCDGGRLVLSDLRMGREPDYVFRFVVAEASDEGSWRSIPVAQLPWPSGDRFDLTRLWDRIWNDPTGKKRESIEKSSRLQPSPQARPDPPEA